MNSSKPPLKFHKTLADTISVHLKQHQRHLLEHGALAATLTPNFMIADTQFLVDSQNLLNYADFPIIVICITQYLTSLLCGFPQPGRPLGQQPLHDTINSSLRDSNKLRDTTNYMAGWCTLSYSHNRHTNMLKWGSARKIPLSLP